MSKLITKPMLAASVADVTELRFPLIASPKLDGIRCLIVGGKALSRSFKPIANNYVRRTLEKSLRGGFDGELMLQHGATFQDVASAIMSHDGEPEFIYHVFDLVVASLGESYVCRIDRLDKCQQGGKWLRVVPTTLIRNLEDLERVERRFLAAGYEGVCLRSPNSPYKCGRSTFKEHYLLKLKRFCDAEAVVVGFEELEHNANEAKPNELGYTKRSTHKAGKIKCNTLGAFVCKPIDPPLSGGKELSADVFRVGTGIGLTVELRQVIWQNRKRYLNRVIKYRYQAHGSKDAPRMPVFLGFRDERDM